MRKKVLEKIELHLKLVNEFKETDIKKILSVSNIIVESLKKGGIIFLCGNGGSAADAQHVAGEFIGRFQLERKTMAAISLSTDTSVLTCIGNDYGFDYIFSRQLEGLIKKDDILWVFSTSGTSINIINACKVANIKKAKVIAFIGKSGSKIEKIADVCFCVETSVTSAIQEIHQLAYHVICGLVEEKLS